VGFFPWYHIGKMGNPVFLADFVFISVTDVMDFDFYDSDEFHYFDSDHDDDDDSPDLMEMLQVMAFVDI